MYAMRAPPQCGAFVVTKARSDTTLDSLSGRSGLTFEWRDGRAGRSASLQTTDAHADGRIMGRRSRWMMGCAIGVVLVAGYVAALPSYQPAANGRKARSSARLVLPELGPKPAPPRCNRAYLEPPALTVPSATQVQDELWSKVQAGPCVYSDRADAADFSLSDGRVDHYFNCNSQSGEWKARGRRFVTNFVMTTKMGCDGDSHGDVNVVETWGMSADGRLYLLNRSGKVEIVLAQATTQDPQERCQKQHTDFPTDNVKAECAQADAGGYLSETGWPLGCIASLDSNPPQVEFRPPAKADGNPGVPQTHPPLGEC